MKFLTKKTLYVSLNSILERDKNKNKKKINFHIPKTQSRKLRGGEALKGLNVIKNVFYGNTLEIIV
jgi:hypothetical protein